MTHEEACELLRPCKAAMAEAMTPVAQALVINKEISKIAGIVRRGDLDRKFIDDEIIAEAEAYGFYSDVGTGIVSIAISKALQYVNGHDEHPREAETPLLTPSVSFTDNLVIPEYLVDGILQRGYVYSLTAAPGAGKTALALLLSLCISRGLPFGKRNVDKGGVLYFAGENQDDVRMRWIALCQRMDVDEKSIDNVWFVCGAHRFSEIGERLLDETAHRNLSLVVIDTSAVFFEGEEENSNTEMQIHATRIRELMGSLDGGPTVIVLAHPPKNASPDNLTPRGGGAFLGSMDGNLVCRKTDSSIEFHHDPQKFRGPEFEPMNFQLKSVTHERLVTSKGTLIPTVVCLPLSDDAVDGIKEAATEAEDAVLVSLRDDGAMTVRERAKRLGWVNQKGEPLAMRVHRCFKALQDDGLVKQRRKKWVLTEAGTKEAKKLKNWISDDDEADEKL